MLGVPRELIEHSLNVHPQAVPKKQYLRRFAHDKREAIRREIAKLLAAGFGKEVIHPEWVANPVLVRKKIMNGECALITPISTSTARRITSGYRALIKSWTRRRVVYSSASLIAIQDITRLRSRRKIKLKARSSPHSGQTLTKLCLWGCKTQEPPISARFRCALLISCIETLKPTWMTWSSRPGISTT
jgi:hypothetical protein